MIRLDTAWQNEALAKGFLENVRGGIPYAADQLEIMLRVIDANGMPVESFADLGCGGGADVCRPRRFPEGALLSALRA